MDWIFSFRGRSAGSPRVPTPRVDVQSCTGETKGSPSVQIPGRTEEPQETPSRKVKRSPGLTPELLPGEKNDKKERKILHGTTTLSAMIKNRPNLGTSKSKRMSSSVPIPTRSGHDTKKTRKAKRHSYGAQHGADEELEKLRIHVTNLTYTDQSFLTTHPTSSMLELMEKERQNKISAMASAAVSPEGMQPQGFHIINSPTAHSPPASAGKKSSVSTFDDDSGKRGKRILRIFSFKSRRDATPYPMNPGSTTHSASMDSLASSSRSTAASTGRTSANTRMWRCEGMSLASLVVALVLVVVTTVFVLSIYLIVRKTETKESDSGSKSAVTDSLVKSFPTPPPQDIPSNRPIRRLHYVD